MPSLPYLRSPVFPDGQLIRFQHSEQRLDDELERSLLDQIYDGGVDLDSLARQVYEAGAAEDPDSALAQMRTAFENPENLVGTVDLELEDEYDIIVVEQGYGGVYVHTVEFMKRLRERWKCLLLCPEDPLFEDDPEGDRVTLRTLRKIRPDFSYFSYVHLMRSIVKRTPCRLLLFAHRSQSLYLFDVVKDRNTVVYCDGFYDGLFQTAKHIRMRHTEATRRRVLAEMYYLLGNGEPDFLGLPSTPAINPHVLVAGYFSLRDARENWCWGRAQTDAFTAAFPQLAKDVHFMPPFTDPELFHEDWVERERVVLFTTTMHNIEKKGFPELVEAMQSLETCRVRCVVRQPHLLPPYPEEIADRLEIGGLKKPAMVELYHHVWVNCRTSREESSPVSILEAMICELPQIVSPTVAEQIPILEDGETGFIVDPDDVPALVEALRTILGDRELRDRMGTEARRRALEYSFDNRVEAFERNLR
jgi:glycosyltransferase involved in cell wall biosynthesis